MTPENQEYELRINATIRNTSPGGGYLSIEESVTVDAVSFLELATILGKFHELAQKIQSEKEG